MKIKPIAKPAWFLFIFAPGMGFCLSIAVTYAVTVSGFSKNILASAGIGGAVAATAMLPDVFARRKEISK